MSKKYIDAEALKEHISSFTGMFTDYGFMVDLQAVLRAIDFLSDDCAQERRKDAIEHINAQLNHGYIDLGAHDEDEIEVLKEAMQVLKFVDAYNNIPNVLNQ